MLIKLILLLLVPMISFSQECKYDVNTYDKFLKVQKLEKEVKVNKANGVGDGYMAINFCKYDTSLFFRITYINRRGAVVGTRDAIMFLFDNDSSIKAYPDQVYSSNYKSSTNQQVLHATYNSDNLAALKTNKVKAIRLYYNDVYTDIDLKDKFSSQLQTTAKCLIK